MRFERLGWVAAAALAGAFVATGFQANTAKFGTVDVVKVVNQSKFAKAQTDLLQGMGRTRQGVLDFVLTLRAVKAEDAQKFRDLSLKDNPTPADKAAIDALKASIQADEDKFRNLQTKATPTADEQKQLADYNQRAQAIAGMQAKWAQEFDSELAAKQGTLRQEAVERVKTAVGEVARSQGYTLVFGSDTALYSANDLTAETLKAMDKK